MFENNMKFNPIRIGFIGAGKWIQTYHLPTAQLLSKGNDLVVAGIWNRTKATALALKDNFMIEQVFDSPDELISSPCIDGVVIAVSREATASLLRLTHKYQKPVLVEKPPARDYLEASLLAKDVTNPVLVAFNRAFTPLFTEVQKIDVNQIQSGRVVFHRKERADAQFVIETGIHALMNNHLLFGNGTLIHCKKIPTKNPEVPRWIATVEYPTIRSIRIEYDFHPYSNQSIERYFYSTNTKEIGAFFKQHYAPDDLERLEAIDKGTIETQSFMSYNSLIRQGYVGEYEMFISMIRENTSSPITISDAATVMKLATQIQDCL